jgi:hypothetical protein
LRLIDSIDAYLLDHESWERKSHYASDITACRRQLYYKWMETPKTNPPSAGAMWKMEMGKRAEDIITSWAEWAKERGEIKSYDTQVHYRVHPDGLANPIGLRFDWLIDGEMGVELKTSFGRGIKEIQKTGYPKEEHMAQVLCYIKLTPIKMFKLIYFGRDNGYRTEFTITDHEDGLIVNGTLYELNIDDYIANLVDVELALDAGKKPDRDYQVAIKGGEIRDKFQAANVMYNSDWQCRYCDFRDRCWSPVVQQSIETGKSYIGDKVI